MFFHKPISIFCHSFLDFLHCRGYLMYPNRWEYRGHFADGRLEGYVSFRIYTDFSVFSNKLCVIFHNNN